MEALPVRDLRLRDASDEEILAAARQAGAIIMTKDRDFVTLALRQPPPPHVIWITCGNTSNARMRLLLTKVLSGALLDRRLVHDRPPQWCRFDRSGRHLVSIDGDRFAWVWDWETGDGKPRECIRSADERTFKSAWFSADGTEVLTVDTEQSVERWPIDLAGKGDELAQRWRLRENAR
jgi:predicted nuclease of predicted toxin-antitoxin system